MNQTFAAHWSFHAFTNQPTSLDVIHEIFADNSSVFKDIKCTKGEPFFHFTNESGYNLWKIEIECFSIIG